MILLHEKELLNLALFFKSPEYKIATESTSTFVIKIVSIKYDSYEKINIICAFCNRFE